MILHILGGGPGQLSAIKKCRSLGITSFVTDLNTGAPGCLAADYAAEASTFDADATIKAAELFQFRNSLRIDALLVTGTDQPVLTAARTAAALGIQYFLDEKQALQVTNKKEMKTRLIQSGIRVSPGRFIARGFSEKQLSGLSFPVVVKPLDSQGQRGVYRLETAEEIGQRLGEVLGFSRCGEILVEEYCPSDEITLSGWIIDGKLFILSVTDRITIENPPSIGVCIAHHYPTKYSRRMPEIRRLTEQIISAFNLVGGPVYFQYLIGGSGQIIVNEIACRPGGAYEDEFIPYITGIDILDVMIKFSCGLEYNAGAFKEHEDRVSYNEGPDRVVSVQMFFCREGTICGLKGMDEVLKLPEVSGGSFLKRPGTVIKKRLNSTQRAGYFIVCSNDETEADKTVKLAYSMLRIEDENGANMIQFYDKMLFGGR